MLSGVCRDRAEVVIIGEDDVAGSIGLERILDVDRAAVQCLDVDVVAGLKQQ